MTPFDPDDPIFERLKQLPSLAPDRERTDRHRVRCRTQLGRSRRRYRMRTDALTGFKRSAIGPIVFAAFCLLYIVGLVTTAVRLHRLFQ
jgi:hypothetical protein